VVERFLAWFGCNRRLAKVSKELPSRQQRSSTSLRFAAYTTTRSFGLRFEPDSVRRWWQKLRRARYPGAHSLTITADCGH
jgi:hypothetical protein